MRARPPDAVVIDVIATNARGQAVETLKASDFVLREDGEVQAIQDVRFVKADGNARLFAIYLDDYYVSAARTQEVRDALHRFVDQDLRPDDLVTILRPLDSLLSIRLTRDRDALHRAIDAFEGRRGDYAPRTAFERNYMVNDQAHAEVQRTQSTWSTLNALALHLANLGDRPQDDAPRQRAGGSDAAPARPRVAADVIVGDADGEPRERGDLRPRSARRGRQGGGSRRGAEPAQRSRR